MLKKTKQKEIEELKRKARKLYGANFTTREIGKIIGRSHAWVALVVKKERNKKIIKKIKRGNYQVDIAKDFNISPAMVSKIKRRYDKRSV